MAAPTYETDLEDFDLAEDEGTFVEMTGYLQGGTPSDESD